MMTPRFNLFNRSLDDASMFKLYRCVFFAEFVNLKPAGNVKRKANPQLAIGSAQLKTKEQTNNS